MVKFHDSSDTESTFRDEASEEYKSTMVLMLDGNSEVDAQEWREKAVQIWDYSRSNQMS